MPQLFRLHACISCATLSLAVLFAPHAVAEPTYFRLNDPLAAQEAISSGVSETKNGKHAVYTKRKRLTQSPWAITHLYSTDRRGGEEFKLSQDPTGTGTGVFTFLLSANSRFAVYTSAASNSARRELFSVDLASHEVHQLNGNLVNGGTVSNFMISPDGETVIYVADQDIDNVNEFYRVPVSGGAPQKIHPAYTQGQNGYLGYFTSDSQYFVFSSNVNGSYQLFSSQLTTSALTKISGNLTGVYDFSLSPDNQRAVFTAASTLQYNVDLYSVKLDGTALTQISPALQESSQMWSNYVLREISPDSQYVAYRSDHDVAGRFEFFAVNINGGKPVRISQPRTESWRTNSVAIHKILPDNTVIFTNDREPDFRFHIYAASATDGSIRQLTHEYQGNKFRFAAMSPDGQYVLYRASETLDFNAPTNLYMVPVSGGTPRQINPTFAPGRDVYGAQVSYDNQWIVYHADQRINDNIELFRVPLKGGQIDRLNPDSAVTVGAGRGSNWYISDDSTRVYYSGEINTAGVNELYSSILPIEVPMDIKPASCPNQFNMASRGMLSAALVNNGRIDLTDVIPESIRLSGVQAFNPQFSDVATPVAPVFGKSDSSQCNANGADGALDLMMHFASPDVSSQLDNVSSGDEVLIELNATLQSGGTIIAEDFIKIKK